MLACKHASSTSAVQQSADIGRQFAVTKSANKPTTSINLPSDFGLKGYIENLFDVYKANVEIILKLPARKAMIDHYVRCPELYGTSIQTKTKKRYYRKWND